jgi:hypothetical protein
MRNEVEDQTSKGNRNASIDVVRILHEHSPLSIKQAQ